MKEITAVDKTGRVARLLDYYQIEDGRSQIKNYLKTYSSQIQNKLRPGAAGSGTGDNTGKNTGGTTDATGNTAADTKEIYIGEVKGHLGDNVNYTALPRFLSQEGYRVSVHKNRYAADLYNHNPYVAAVTDLRGEGREPWGAFTELGWGTAVQRRAFSHGISLPETKGEFFVTAGEQAEAKKMLTELGAGSRIAILHTTGKSVGRAPWKKKHWNALAAELGAAGYTVVQVGGKEDKKIKSCHIHLLKASIRTIITTVSVADFFVGPNSGFMHIAAALEIPSLILLFEVAAAEVQLPVLADNIVLPKKVDDHLFHLYPQNMHTHIGGDGSDWVPAFDATVLTAALEQRLFRWDAAVAGYLDLL